MTRIHHLTYWIIF